MDFGLSQGRPYRSALTYSVRAPYRIVKRLTLTLRGQVAAAILKPGFKPFAVVDLQAAIREFQAEREPRAMSLLRNEEDARQWRAHLAHERSSVKRRLMRLAAERVKRGQSAWFKEQVDGWILRIFMRGRKGANKANDPVFLR